MSRDLIADNEEFQKKYGFDQGVFDKKKLDFRMDLQAEEFNELMEAYKNGDAEEIVDALIDSVVIALGTLYLADVDIEKAWTEVFAKNMLKIRGVKPGREQSGGFDVRKPTQEDVDNGLADKVWTPPSHADNLGTLKELFE